MQRDFRDLRAEDAEAVSLFLAEALPGFERLTLPAAAHALARLLWEYQSWATLAGRRGCRAEVQRIADAIGDAESAGLTMTRDEFERVRVRARQVLGAGGSVATLRATAK